MPDLVADLLGFIDSSPTPYHAVAEVERRLIASRYQRLAEDSVWELAAGDRRYVVRGDGSLVAFEVGSVGPSQGGFRIVGAHTDSPNLRLKPCADVEAHGYRQVGVEPYGGVLLHTWLDRDLSLAGRVTLLRDSGPETRLVDFGRPLLRVPNLAIHLQRELRDRGLKLDAQRHMLPVSGLEDAPPMAELIASELRAKGDADVRAEDVLAFDIMTYDVQASLVSGAQGEFIHAARLDNLASCHAATTAMLDAGETGLATFTRTLVLYDHEEVGSRSAQGAAGTLLSDVLGRAVEARESVEAQGFARAVANSVMISADMAHAVHPNYADRHEPEHRPRIGGGPVIKTNAGQAYASNASTAGFFAALCREVDVVPQHFVSRSDLTCGSTIGPITAARLGLNTVDVGNPMLSMHSAREMAGTADVEPMIATLRAFYR